MPKRATTLDLAAITLDPSLPIALVQQLYNALRAAILSGRLTRGAHLPSTRTLCATLNVSRNTVVATFEQLIAEGYLESRVGDGTYVCRALPDDLLHVRTPLPRFSGASIPTASPLTDGRIGVFWDQDEPAQPFRPDLLALDHFPKEIWARLLARRWRNATPALLGYGDPAGYRPLREAIAGYLGAARGVHCTPDQVIVIGGAQQGVDLAVRVLLKAGDTVWIEDPGYMGARAALLAVGAKLIPVPVDAEGLDVEAGIAAAPTARAVYVSPSHQFPIGVTMSLTRRLALLEWAKRAPAWLFEDDYDSEYRYVGRPLSSLQGLDTSGRVIYIGTFSKVLFPALRLGYLVVPPTLVDVFTQTRALADRQSPTVEQAVLADFIQEGHFARHIRRMRTIYAERQQALVQAVRTTLGDQLVIERAEAGLYVAGWLPPGVDDRVVAARAELHGVSAPPLSNYALTPMPRGGLRLGFAALTPEQIREGVQRLKAALEPNYRLRSSE